MKHHRILTLAILVWLGTLVLLIPSPTRGLTLVSVLLLMGLPTWMLGWPIINWGVLLSFPISLLLMLVASASIVFLAEGRKRIAFRVALMDLGILVLFSLLAIALWL